MTRDDCWIAYFSYYATGEGMHYVVALAQSAERATSLFDACTSRYRGNATTTRLVELLKTNPGALKLFPGDVQWRMEDPLCWTLEYSSQCDFNCA